MCSGQSCQAMGRCVNPTSAAQDAASSAEWCSYTNIDHSDPFHQRHDPSSLFVLAGHHPTAGGGPLCHLLMICSRSSCTPAHMVRRS